MRVHARRAPRFIDRRSAGRELASPLRALGAPDPVVLGLARGGLPVAYELALALEAPLDVLVVRKIGAPDNPELGIGAVAEEGVRVLNDETIRHQHITADQLEAAAAQAAAELEERVQRYHSGRPQLDLRGRTAIVVDDGLATGGTARAALQAVRLRKPKRLILAVPVGARETVRALREQGVEVICLLEPEFMGAVGLYYDRFEPVSDEEVAQILAGDASSPPAPAPPLPPGAPPIPPAAGLREARIAAGDGVELIGDLMVPEQATGLVVFAHGSGSGRHSPRNSQVAHVLNEHGLTTLLVDLLTPEEARGRANVFDIGLMAQRLIAATRWTGRQPELAALPVGYFGASTGAGAALLAAADLGAQIRAVVSRGGRPDLAGERLTDVRAPVLLIVGGRDDTVLELNREAQRLLRGQSELAVVRGATHLFEEPGALEQVAERAARWFARHLTGPTGSGARA